MIALVQNGWSCLDPGGRGNLDKNPKSPRIQNKFACYFYFNY